ncbi:MAG: PAS domain S-box protein [Kiritimatiellia bacterium]|nr:PAS domain S-box protein [Kiritimatiellia bacterium]
MGKRSELSKTMRIDLIPDAPENGKSGKEKVRRLSAPKRTTQQMNLSSTQQVDSPYDQLLQSIYDAVLITDFSGRIADANRRAVDFLLRQTHQLRSMTIFDVISGADESLIEALRENLKLERYALIQAYCVRSDGTMFPSEIAVNRVCLEGDERLCFFLRDVTVRRQAEEMLRTEHTAIQNAGDGIAVADLLAVLEYSNPAVARMWGYQTADDLLGVPVQNLMDDKAAATSMVQSLVDGQKSWIGEMPARRADGGVFDIQVSVARNINSDGEMVGFVFSFIDIGDRKRAEEALRETERHDVMLESLGAACHHLGQPATVLMGNLELMQNRMAVSGENRSMEQLVQSSLEAMERLKEVLDRLNSVHEYKTTTYTEQPIGRDDIGESRILDI